MNIKLKLFLLLGIFIVIIEGLRYLYNEYIHKYSYWNNFIINIIIAIFALFLGYILFTKLNINLSNTQLKYLSNTATIFFGFIIPIVLIYYWYKRGGSFMITNSYRMGTYIDITCYCIAGGTILFLPN